MRKIIFLFAVLFVLDMFVSNPVVISSVIPLAIPIALAGVSALSSVLGSAKASSEVRKNERQLRAFQDENLRDYISNYYDGGLESRSSKAYLKRLDESMRDQQRISEGQAVSTGATQENILAAKQSQNRAMSEAVSGIVAQDEQKKESARERYLQRKMNLMQGEMGMRQQKAQNWITTAQGIASAAGSAASAFMPPTSGLSTDYSIAAGGAGHTPQYLQRFRSQMK